MMRAHYPYTCGAIQQEGNAWYPIEYFERLRADGEFE
jgi:hypothetical protein